jgi:hypothetical protein
MPIIYIYTVLRMKTLSSYGPIAGPTLTDRLLYGPKRIGDADINLFRAFFSDTEWKNAVGGENAIAGIESTIRELGIDEYRAPCSPQLRLADFIRGVLGVPGGYDRVMLRNADGSMTLFRAAGPRHNNALQRRVDYCHCIGSGIGNWNKMTFDEELYTSSKDLDKLEKRVFRPNFDFFRGLVNLPQTAPAVPVSPSGEEHRHGNKVLSIVLNEIQLPGEQVVDDEVAEAESARRRSDSLDTISDPAYQEMLARLLDTGPVPERGMPSKDQSLPAAPRSIQNGHGADHPVDSTHPLASTSAMTAVKSTHK